jgi:UbiD family decarboxylase
VVKPFIKIVIVVDDDVDPYDTEEVNWAVATRVQPGRDIAIKKGMPGLSIDPSAGKQEVTGEFSILAKTRRPSSELTPRSPWGP